MLLIWKSMSITEFACHWKVEPEPVEGGLPAPVSAGKRTSSPGWGGWLPCQFPPNDHRALALLVPSAPALAITPPLLTATAGIARSSSTSPLKRELIGPVAL